MIGGPPCVVNALGDVLSYAPTPRGRMPDMTLPAPLSLQSAILTHVGMRRMRNEDCIAIGGSTLNTPMTEPRLVVQDLSSMRACIVADGMGGHPAGDVASRFVADHLLMSLDDAVRDEDALDAALIDANRSLFAEMDRVPALYGMGTTVAGIVVHREGILAFNVGDSRVYRIDAGKVVQLSVDHTMELGGVARVGNKPPRVLSQCLGGFLSGQEIEPHIARLPMDAGAEFLICSDGLHDMLTDRDIEGCISSDLCLSVQTLFEAAMREGGVDNISIIQARVTRSA